MARFEVGQAFLQVVPSLKRLHKDIAAEVAKIRDIEIPVRPDMSTFHEQVAAETSTIRDAHVGVVADTAKADAQLGAFVTKMRAQLDAAIKALPELELYADATDAERRIREIKAELLELRDQRVGIDVDADTASARIKALSAELATLSHKSVDIQVKYDTSQASQALRLLENETISLISRLQNVNLGSTMFAGIGALILPAITSIGQLTGALGLIPALGLGAGTALGSLVVGSQGMGDAMKAASAASEAAAAGGTKAKEAADAYAKTLDHLAPSAREVVSAVGGLKPAFDSTRLDVQQELFRGLGKDITDLGTTALPVVRSGLTQMASGLNDTTQNIAKFATSKTAISDYQTIFNNIGVSAHNLAGSAQPILQIFTDVAKVGSEFLPQLAQNFSLAAQHAADFVNNARDTGQLHEWIQTGLSAVRELWGALKDVVAIVKDLTVMGGFGPNFLEALHLVTTTIRWVIENVPGATTIVQLFFDAWLFAKVAQGILGMVGTIKTVTTAVTTATVATQGLAAAEAEVGVAGTAASLGAGKLTGVFKLLGVGVGAYTAGLGLLAIGQENAGKGFQDMARDGADTAGKLLTFDFGGIAEKIGRDWNQLPNDLDTARGRLATAWDAIKGAAQSTADGVVSAVTTVKDALVSYVEVRWNATMGVVDEATGVIQSIISTAGSYIGRAWDATMGAIDSATVVIQNISSTATSYVSRVWNASMGALDYASGVIQGIIGTANSYMNRAWNGVVGAVDSATGVIQGVIGTAGSYANRAWSAIIDARDNASGVIGGILSKLQSIAGRVWTAVVSTVTGQAAGGILKPMSSGGVLAMQGGGHLTPMGAGVARIVPPNTWRVIGDNLTSPEGYIPINQSATSMVILDEVARRMGRAVVPRSWLPVLERLMPLLRLQSGQVLETDDAGRPVRYGPDAPVGDRLGYPQTLRYRPPARWDLSFIRRLARSSSSHVINVYPQPQQSEQAIAEMVARRQAFALRS